VRERVTRGSSSDEPWSTDESCRYLEQVAHLSSLEKRRGGHEWAGASTPGMRRGDFDKKSFLAYFWRYRSYSDKKGSKPLNEERKEEGESCDFFNDMFRGYFFFLLTRCMVSLYLWFLASEVTLFLSFFWLIFQFMFFYCDFFGFFIPFYMCYVLFDVFVLFFIFFIDFFNI
jgi:hypothetical protein